MGTLKEMLSADRFAAETGVELLEISPGYAKARMKVTEKHLNAGGVCQGGALFTLAAVANSRGRLTLSLNANITFLRAISEGYVYAEATETFNHGRVPFIEVRLVDEQQQLIAVLTSSGYRKSEELNIDELE